MTKALKELRHIVHAMRVFVGNGGMTRDQLSTLTREIELATDHAEIELLRARNECECKNDATVPHLADCLSTWLNAGIYRSGTRAEGALLDAAVAHEAKRTGKTEQQVMDAVLAVPSPLEQHMAEMKRLAQETK